MNSIRIPFNYRIFTTETYMGQNNPDRGFELIDRVIGWCKKENIYVMLDMHWNNADEWGKNIGQHQMPDMNTLEFWKDCAKVYKNNPGVWFDLYNEPHDVSWLAVKDSDDFSRS